MSVVEDDFNQRCDEIEQYLQHLAELEAETRTNVSLMATMKASAMLMIYNLVESTAANSIESIYDHLKAEEIGFVAVDDALKAMVIKCARDSNPQKLVKRMRDEALDFAVAAFKKEMVFSGNVDSMKIRELWDDYGIARSDGYAEATLLEVKTARNDLAHGAKSFSELGRSLTVSELAQKFESTKALLFKALKDVESHIANHLRKAAA
jgi:hypothetical protein